MDICKDSKPASALDDEALWKRLRDDQDESARAELIKHYHSTAKNVAGRLYARRTIDDVEYEDYLHYAIVGLIESIDRFDPTRNIPFVVYSSQRMRGAIINGVQKYTELREQIGHRARIRRERLRSLSGESPTESDEHQLFGNIADIVVNLALGYFLEDSDLHLHGMAYSGDQVMEAVGLEQLRRQVSGIVTSLPTRERVVIQYHYYYQMNFSEIAVLLDLSTGRVSQLHKRAIGKVREYLRVMPLDAHY